MADLVQKVTLGRAKANKNIADFKAGDTVGVYVRVREGEKERVQLYKGVVMKIQGSGASCAFTVRKVSGGVGVERTFPYLSPALDRVELISVGKVRRSRLYFLRGLKGRAAKLVSELVGATEETSAAADQAETAEKSAQ